MTGENPSWVFQVCIQVLLYSRKGERGQNYNVKDSSIAIIAILLGILIERSYWSIHVVMPLNKSILFLVIFKENGGTRMGDHQRMSTGLKMNQMVTQMVGEIKIVP